MNDPHKNICEFGPFRLDAVERLLEREGVFVSLPPKIFDMLVVLVRHRGHLITKDELMREVWAGSFVEEGNITVNISALRKALGERDNADRYIETVPKRGYRFVMPVREVSVDGELLVARRTSASITVTETEEETETGVGSQESGASNAILPILRRHRVAASVLLVLVMMVAAGVSLRWISAKGSKAAAVPHNEDVRERVRTAFTMIDDEGRGEEAIPILRDVLKSDPNNALAHWSLSEAYRYGGMLDESIAEGELAIRLDPKVTEETTLNTYFYAGQYEKFLASTQGQPDFPRTKFYRGLVYLYLKDKAHAIAEFDRASQLAPTLFHARLGQAFKSAIDGDHAGGIKVLQQLEREDVPHDGELFYKVAQGYALLEDKRSALRVLRLSIERNFFCLPYMIQDPFLEGIRRESEYIQLMEYAGRRHEEFKRKFF